MNWIHYKGELLEHNTRFKRQVMDELSTFACFIEGTKPTKTVDSKHFGEKRGIESTKYLGRAQNMSGVLVMSQ